MREENSVNVQNIIPEKLTHDRPLTADFSHSQGEDESDGL
jgi:hypothetical protein